MKNLALRSLRLHLGVAALLAVGLTTLALAQQSPQSINVGGVRITGVSDDWSQRHVVFSDPGTEQDAYRDGTHEQWLSVVNDPRYIMQQLKRHQPARGPAAEDVARIEAAAAATDSSASVDSLALLEPAQKKKKLKTDWSMTLGSGGKVGAGQYPAVFSAFTQANCDNVSPPSQPDFVVYNTGLPGAAATAATQMGTFSGIPSAGDVTITDGSNTLTMTNSGTTGNATGSFTGFPTSTSSPTITITSGSNTVTLTLSSGAAIDNQTGTFSITGGAFTGTVHLVSPTTGGTNSTLVLTSSSSGTNTCSSSTAGTFKNSSASAITEADDLATAINACNASFPSSVTFVACSGDGTVTATGCTKPSSSSALAMVATIPGATPVVSRTTGGGTLTLATTTAGSNGTTSTSCGGSSPNFTSSFATGSSTTAVATALGSGSSSAIGVCAASLGITAPTESGSSVTVTESNPGQFSATPTSGTPFSWTTVNPGTNGSNTCSSSTTGTFATSSSTMTVASNLAAAINMCPAAVGVSANSNSSSTVTVTALTPGLAGDSIMLGDTLSNFSWISGTLAGGADNSSIIAYDNLYSSCSGSKPLIYWQYNTIAGNTIPASVVLSEDGTQVAFVQTSGSIASLVVLKWAKSADPMTLTNTAATNYRACGAPCMTALTFSGSPNATISAPYYDYGSDVAYVGDNSGKLHKFVGLFSGTPAECTSSNTTAPCPSPDPWPITVDSGDILTGPVEDPNTHNIFVGDSSGTLSYVRDTSSTTGTCRSGTTLPCLGEDVDVLSTGPIADGPLLDSSEGMVFAFSGVTSGDPIEYEVLQDNEALSIASPSSITFSGITGRTYTSNARVGAFDNIYYTSGPSTGHLYVCAPDNNGSSYYNGASLYRIGFNSSGVMNTSTSNGPLAMVSASPANGTTADECSPLQEFYNGATDYLFAGVAISADLTGCTGSATVGCLYNFNITSAFPSGSVAGLAVTGNTSGIVIDNPVTGGENIYFTSLSNESCAGNGTTGAGTGGCAIQTSQAAP